MEVQEKKASKLRRVLITVVVIVLIAITAVATKFALGSGEAAIEATVNTSSVSANQQVVVTVMAHTGSQTVNVARARVTYDATKWQFISANFTGTPFVDRTPEPPAHQGSGYYEVTGYRISSPFPSGDFLIGKITLQALNTSGSTQINIDQNNSALYDATNASNILGSVSGAEVTIASSNPQECNLPGNSKKQSSKRCK